MGDEPSITAIIDDLIRRAEAHHDAGRYEEAYALYCEGLTIDPSNARLYAERGNELSWLDRREESQVDLTEAIRLDPTKAYYFESRGLGNTWLKDYPAAIRDFAEAIRLAPENADNYDQRSCVYVRMEDHSAAIQDLTEAVRLDPGNPKRHASKGIANFNLIEDYNAAIQDFTHAINLEPNNPQHYRYRGNAYSQLDDNSAAVQDFTKAIELEPNNPTNHSERAAATHESDPEAADVDFRRAIELGTESPYPYLFVANRASEAEDWVTTERICSACVDHHSEVPTLIFLLGQSLYEQERYAEALEPLAAATKAIPDGANMAYYYAQCLWELGRYRDSIPAFDEVMRLDPTLSNAWYRRGFAHWALDNNEQALADATEGLRLEPDSATILALRAKVWIDLEQPDKALPDIEQALREEPENREYRLMWAKVLSKTGRSEQALAEVQVLLAAEPNDPLAHWRLAEILEALEEYDDALDAYERNLALGGDERAALLRMGICYNALGDVESVLACAMRTAEIAPDESIDKFFCGYALSRLGETEEARKLFTEAIALDADSWNSYYHRGNSWEVDDEFELALADYNRAIALQPEKSNLRVSRAKLYALLEDYPHALEDYHAIIRLEPETAWHYWRRSELWEEVGDYRQAEADAVTAEKLDQQAEDTESAEIDEEIMTEEKMKIWTMLQGHFGGVPLDEITLTERHFPVQVGADLQKALETLEHAELKVLHFWVTRQCGNPVTSFPDAYLKNRRNPVLAGPPRYQEIDIGEAEPVQALRNGLWLLKAGETSLALILDTSVYHSIRFQVAALTSAGSAASKIFRHLEETVRLSPSYRGKILSLESREMYSGQNQGLRVHRLRQVSRDEVILPKATLDLLDRNVTRFVKQRSRLIELGLNGKKGLLFYGPPGTGKTHTIHYLAQSVPEQTTFLISANQVAVLDEYMTLARLFQPSLVVIEDVDLIARQREEMRSASEEALLNKLLNEMDGLQLDSQVLFVLTTNRPEALEAALASRPGRVDQAIEFPLPDEEGRTKLARLYSGKLTLSDTVVMELVARTHGLTASFLKELMRRAAQIALERGESQHLNERDVGTAFEELLLLGGTLNRKLLGVLEPSAAS